MGESRSISEAHKSNLVQELAKTIKWEAKSHTQCEQKQDNFILYNYETYYYKVYNIVKEFCEALEANCEHTSQNCQNGIKSPYVSQSSPKSAQTATNLSLDMDEVIWVNYYTLDNMGVEIWVV